MGRQHAMGGQHGECQWLKRFGRHEAVMHLPLVCAALPNGLGEQVQSRHCHLCKQKWYVNQRGYQQQPAQHTIRERAEIFHPLLILAVNDLDASILRPTTLAMPTYNRLLFAVTDHFNLRR